MSEDYPPVCSLGTCVWIRLTRGMFAYVDEIDADLAQLKWFWQPGGKGGGRAARKIGRKQFALHRIVIERILGRPLASNEEVDHINHDPLDNRRSNMRVVTRAGNNRNRRGWGKYPKGVSYDPRSKKFRAILHIGSFDTPEEAGSAWERAVAILRKD